MKFCMILHLSRQSPNLLFTTYAFLNCFWDIFRFNLLSFMIYGFPFIDLLLLCLYRYMYLLFLACVPAALGIWIGLKGIETVMPFFAFCWYVICFFYKTLPILTAFFGGIYQILLMGRVIFFYPFPTVVWMTLLLSPY